jgi:hypothetical protein
MRILVVAWHPQYVLRLYEPALRALAAAGHSIHLGFTSTTLDALRTDAGEFLDQLCREFPAVSYGTLPARDDLWRPLLEQVRCARTCLAYQHSWFDGSPGLRARAREGLWPLAAWLLRSPLARPPVMHKLLDRLLRGAERALPPDTATTAAIRAHRPDLVFITPLVHAPARQTDYLKSAQALGLPNVVGVASWDNLTTKGFIQLPPESLLVWNEAQRREAAELHGVAPERVVVTGAQAYDHWFEQRPSTTREAFCQRIGLDPTRPILLYLCSSRFFQNDERPFIRQWLEAVRGSSDPLLSRSGVIIRPYPTSHRANWADFDLRRFGNAVVWPQAGQAPIAREAKEAYFDSLYHSAAVVAANTSGLIEAGIAGRRCFSLLAPEFAQKQAGMPHFSYLKDSGFLATAWTLEEHLAQLQQELAGAGPGRERMAAFLASFIRPHGLERPATPIVVAAIEGLAARPKAEPRRPFGGRLVLRSLLVAPAVACLVRDRVVAWGRKRFQEWRSSLPKAKSSGIGTETPSPATAKKSASAVAPKRGSKAA